MGNRCRPSGKPWNGMPRPTATRWWVCTPTRGSRPGRSTRNRTAFMQMLRDVEVGKIDVILFIRLDRWFRNVADYYEVQRILDAHGVQWVATEERYDTTTANGRLNLNIRLSIAQDESDRTAERIRFVFADKLRRREVISGKIPLGYRIREKRLVEDPEQAAVVRELFAYYLQCGSVRQTARYLLETHGIAYSPSGLRELLRNRRYMGAAHGYGDFCPPLVPEAVFQRVQALLDQRAPRRAKDGERTYLFSGLLWCRACGSRMSGHVVRGHYVYYRCGSHDRQGACSQRRAVNEAALERSLLEALEQQCRGVVFTMQAGESRQEQSSRRLQERIQRLQELYVNSWMDREAYQEQYNNLCAQAAAAAAPGRPPHWKDPLELYRALDREDQRAFWMGVLRRIEVDGDGGALVFPAEHFP